MLSGATVGDSGNYSVRISGSDASGTSFQTSSYLLLQVTSMYLPVIYWRRSLHLPACVFFFFFFFFVGNIKGEATFMTSFKK
jgi:hypothetical protein